MITDAFRLDDKVALVTGASKGIGACIASTFAAAGADVVLLARSETELRKWPTVSRHRAERYRWPAILQMTRRWQRRGQCAIPIRAFGRTRQQRRWAGERLRVSGKSRSRFDHTLEINLSAAYSPDPSGAAPAQSRLCGDHYQHLLPLAWMVDRTLRLTAQPSGDGTDDPHILAYELALI